MKKLVTAFFLLTGCFHFLQAQTLYGLKAGPQLTQRKLYGGNNTPGQEVPLVAMDAAYTVFSPLDGLFFIHFNFGYSGKGVRVRNLLLTDPLGNDIGMGTFSQLLNYIVISFPVNYRMPISSHVDLFVGGGPYFGYAISGRDKVKSSSSGTSSSSVNLSNGGYRRVDIGGRLEANLVVKEHFLAAISYEAGATSVSNSANNFRNNALGISVGYLFKK